MHGPTPDSEDALTASEDIQVEPTRRTEPAPWHAPHGAQLRTITSWLVLLALIVLARSFVVTPVRISSSSMQPTLHRGDVVLVDRVRTKPSQLRRGDLVTFEHPITGERTLKRLAALPGDEVVVHDAVLRVNGKLVEESYVDVPRRVPAVAVSVVVPAGHLFVLGDNRSDSWDSRSFGPVSAEALDGRVLLRTWPPLR
jgi:signal peptidase I